MRPGLAAHREAVALIPLYTILTALTLFIVFVVFRRGRGSDDDGGGGRGGGSGDRRPSPRDPRPDGEPSWWPEFEREFAAHVSSRTTANFARR